MTDKTTADANSIAADSQAGDLAAPAPFNGEHQALMQSLAADAHVLLTKIEGTIAMTGATQAIANAKAALLAVTSHLYAHFEELAVDIEGKEPASTDAPASTTGA